MELLQDGIEFVPNFLTAEELSDLRVELSVLFSRSVLNGPAYPVKVSKVVQQIQFPAIAIESVNLLEKSLDIFELIQKKPGMAELDFKLANIGVYRELGNPSELLWHSDMRNGGLIRAQVCLTGGQRNSGAFRYFRGTHHLAVKGDVPYEPHPQLLKDSEKDIIVCDRPNGTLFLFNTVGYHSKDTCIGERMSVMFDFLPRSYIEKNKNDVACNIVLTSFHLSERVIRNIRCFENKVATKNQAPNTPDFIRFNSTFGGLGARGFLREAARVSVARAKKKFSSKLNLKA